MKYIAKRDVKRLKSILDDIFKIDSDSEIIRVYIADLGLEMYEEDIRHLEGYKNILAGKENYIPYEKEEE